MLRTIDRFSDVVAGWLRRLGACGYSGAIAGMLAGGILVFLDTFEERLDPSATEAVQIWLIVELFCWLALLFIFVVFVRWRLGSVLVPTLVNSLIVTGLTVLVLYLTHAYGLGFVIGLLIGMLVGLLLCALSRRFLDK